MRLKHLDTLEAIIEADGFECLLDDLHTVVSAKAQEMLNQQNYHEYARWDSHTLCLSTVLEMARETNARHDKRRK